jgi:hypothetical protein
MFPKTMLENLDWCFKEPVPMSSEEFIKAVKNRYKEVFNEDFDATILTVLSSLTRLDIRYSYGVQRPDGYWDDIFVTFRVEVEGEFLSYANILWKIHKNAHNYLKDQDSCFFEGLYLADEEREAGIPLYDIFLGS